MDAFLKRFKDNIDSFDRETHLYQSIDGVELIANFIEPDFWTIDVASVDDPRALQLDLLISFCKRTADCEVAVYESVLHMHPEIINTLCSMGFKNDGNEYWVWSRKDQKRKRQRCS